MRLESKHPEFRRISGAHFREGPDYSAWRANGTNDWLLIHTVSGTGRVTSGGTEMSVLAGDAVLFPPNHPHDYCTAPGFPSWEILFAHFRPPAAWRSLLDWPGQSNGFGHIHVDGEVRKRVISGLRRSTRMARGPLSTAELFAVNALEEALLWFDTQNALTTRTDDRILRVIEFIDAHLKDKLEVSALAEVAGLSASRFSHLFKTQLGVSPQKYVERERVSLAKQLLDFTAHPIGTIAAEVGWGDAMYFSQRFRHATGRSPSAYRKLR